MMIVRNYLQMYQMDQRFIGCIWIIHIVCVICIR